MLTEAELDTKLYVMVATAKRPTVGGLYSRLNKWEPLLELKLSDYDQRKMIEAALDRLIRSGKIGKSGLRLWVPEGRQAKNEER